MTHVSSSMASDYDPGQVLALSLETCSELGFRLKVLALNLGLGFRYLT
jgi:hypothetical protein